MQAPNKSKLGRLAVGLWLCLCLRTLPGAAATPATNPTRPAETPATTPTRPAATPAMNPTRPAETPATTPTRLAATPATAPTRPAETLLPLGPAQVSELVGEASAMSPTARATLHVGDRVPDGQQVQTGPAARLELRFADGTLLRIGPAAALTLLPQLRRIALHRGRVLVAADRMLGGLAVLTRQTALLPEGTTYLAGVTEAGDELTVLEGAVCACAVAPPEASSRPPAPGSAAGSAAPTDTATRPILPPRRDQMILPGEALTLPPQKPGPGPLKPAAPPRPQLRRLAELLKSEPLITEFTRPLPSLRVISGLALLQRRGVLPARNERQRRELFWKRPARPPVKLPPLFNEPDSVIIRYTYPD